MFSRKSCYFFVRPKKSFLEVCVFLGRALKAPQVRRVDRASKSKVVHIIHIRHRDEVESPITDWLREAYDLSGALASETATTVPRRSRNLDLRGRESGGRAEHCRRQEVEAALTREHRRAWADYRTSRRAKNIVLMCQYVGCGEHIQACRC